MRCPSRVNSLSDPTRVIDGASYGVGSSEPESINVSMAAIMTRHGSRRNTLKGSVRLVVDPQSPDPLGLVLTNRPVLIDEWRRMSGRLGIKPIVQLTTFEPRRQPAIALVDLQGDIGIDMDRSLRTVPIVLLLDESLTLLDGCRPPLEHSRGADLAGRLGRTRTSSPRCDRRRTPHLSDSCAHRLDGLFTERDN